VSSPPRPPEQQLTEFDRHVERQMLAQERQIVVARFALVALAAVIGIVLRDSIPTLPFHLAILGAVAFYNVVIALLIGRFPAREVGVVATGLDMIAVTLVVWAEPNAIDSYLIYAVVILGVALRFGFVASVWAAIVVAGLYVSVELISTVPDAPIRPLLPARVAYLLAIGVIGGLFSRVVIGRATENARLQQQLEREAAERARAREVELVATLARELGSTLDRDAVVSAIGRTAAPLLGDLSAVFAIDPGTRRLRAQYLDAPDAGLRDRFRAHLERHPVRIGEGAAGRAAALAMPVRVDASTPADTGDPDGSSLFGWRSVLAVPVLSRGTVRAVIWSATRGERPIGPEQELLLRAVADRAGPALENAGLWADLQAQVARMEALQAVVADITSNLAPSEIAQHLSRSMSAIFSADRTAIFLRAETTDRLVCAAAVNLSAAFTGDVARYLDGLAVGLRQPLFVLDARTDPRTAPLHAAARAEGFASMLILPLVYRDEAIGAMTLHHDRPLDWEVDELALARTFADQAAIALANAALFTRERRAQRFKDDFLSIVSHELRTPLTSIQGYSQLLEARLRTTGGRQKELSQVEVIRSQVQRMRRLVDDLLDVGRIDRLGSVSVEPAPIDLSAELRDVTARLSRANPTRAISLQAPAELPIEADRDRMGQVLTNLTDNAVKYSPEGGPVRVVAAREGDEAVVRVADEGIGIAPEHIGHVFERFYQVDGDVSRRRFGGLGLGLYITQAIVDAHGGTIRAERNAEAGRGTVFTVRLPVRSPHQRAPLPAGGEPPAFVVRSRGP
jgi:signal transduction histidine kinase